DIGFPVAIPIRTVEEVPGVQCTIAQILEGSTMPLVRARCGHHSDLASGAFAILSAVSIAEYVVFPDGVYAEQLLAGALRRYVLARRVVADIVHAIHREAIGFRPLAAHRERGAAGMKVVIHRARVEGQKLFEAASVQWHIFNLSLID